MKKIAVMLVLLVAAASAHATAVSWVASGMKGPGAVSITSVNQMYVELYYTTAIGGNTTEGWNDGIWGSGGSLITGSLIDSFSTAGGKIDPVTYPSSVGNAFWDGVTADKKKDAVDGWASLYMKIYYNPSGTAGNTEGNYTYSGVTRLYDVSLNNILSYDSTLTMTGVTSQSRVDWVPAAVSEPASMALFGLGGIALFIRRKMRKEA